MHQKDFRKLLKKYRRGLGTPEEVAFIEKWYKAMESLQKDTLTPSDRIAIKNRSWAKVHAFILRQGMQRPVSRQPRSFRISSFPGWVMAACLLLFVASVLFLVVGPRLYGDYVRTPKGAMKEISNKSTGVTKTLLPDGSKVFLEPGSRITFEESFDGPQRVVTLEGEAFFQVSRDTLRPFLVDAKDVVTKVLGTSFTVSAFPDQADITVEVKTGKVSVITGKMNDRGNSGATETILTPNQKIIYHKRENTVSRSIVDKPRQVLPPDIVKRMHYDAAPVTEIFEGLEKVYGVDIVFDEHVFSSCILTTSIAEGNIYDRLDMICNAISARYSLKDNLIVIEGSGCKKKK